MSTVNAARIGELIDYLAPKFKNSRVAPSWPPDAFAIAAYLLQRSGAYICVVEEWPRVSGRSEPARQSKADRWCDEIKKIGDSWRLSSNLGQKAPPEVQNWWQTVQRSKNLRLDQICKRKNLCAALLQICAAADEASRGVGKIGRAASDIFHFNALFTLYRTDSLARDVHSTKAKVLPKHHTPQTGMTLRSLTHDLSLCMPADVNAKWSKYIPPNPKLETGVNLLLVPWPKVVKPCYFKIADPPTGKLRNMPTDEYGFFTYEPPAITSTEVMKLFHSAEKLVGNVDAVVFPELALSGRSFRRIASSLTREGVLLIGGVGERAVGEGRLKSPGRNYVALQMPNPHLEPITQEKHHRWKLDRSQILQYGIGTALNPRKQWWEDICIGERDLHFIALEKWLTVCVLICEDLARQDPVAEVVRTVGPNLVIALLMDGPQTASRWSARYATVLADDPGCSVLTLTSLGMANLCRPQNVKARDLSRSIALWKDPKNGTPIEIELPPKAEGVVLSLAPDYETEFSADGRNDEKRTGFPVLAGIHPVTAP